MNPMAVACHRGTSGSVSPSSRSRYRQRMVLSGNVRVARPIASAKGTTLTPLMCPQISGRLTSCSAHQIRRTDIASPAAPVQPKREDLLLLSG